MKILFIDQWQNLAGGFDFIGISTRSFPCEGVGCSKTIHRLGFSLLGFGLLFEWEN